jgi:hypothetical protein
VPCDRGGGGVSTQARIQVGDRIQTKLRGGSTGTGRVLRLNSDGSKGLVCWDDLPGVPIYTVEEYLYNRKSLWGGVCEEFTIVGRPE